MEDDEAQGKSCPSVDGEEEQDDDDLPGRVEISEIPSYPFPADFNIVFDDSPGIGVIGHTCRQHPGGTCALAIFMPGVHGGVGPCRQPGSNFDEAALYASVASRLIDSGIAVDCYRCSWPFMRPLMSHAIGGVCRVLHHGLMQAVGANEDAPRDIRVIFVGHSFGGAVAIHAASAVARHFGKDGRGGQDMPGLRNAEVRLRGLCTLNGAFDVERYEESETILSNLSGCRALLISGDADQVVPPEATAALFKVLPVEQKRHLDLSGGTHDLFNHKEELIEELSRFISECHS
eukprot:TRINITY_DN13609_c0_g2_i1.p1 TRINITY_DN13609_c0_g2~~TRINITY_DN13609_c0_g2_i1.p1  ORF type:complete len:316 (-),score=52.99 TRINITY_DN13609_c0_g2_i1:99-968(-)